MLNKIFITGTDTNVGKTYFTAKLLRALGQLGYSTLGIKPVASGAYHFNGSLCNEDALLLQEASSIKLDYHHINPFVFEPPIAPNIAAELKSTMLSVDQLNEKCRYALNYPADICLIEGAGGWHVPLNNKETLADFVNNHQFPVLLIVDIRLGCINHAILTCREIQRSGATLIGWVANKTTAEVLYASQLIQTIQAHLSVPLLSILPHDEPPSPHPSPASGRGCRVV